MEIIELFECLCKFFMLMVSFSVDIVDEHVLTAFNSETLTQHCSKMLSNIDRGIQLDYADVSSVLEGPL